MSNLKYIFERLNSKYLLSLCIWVGPTIHTRCIREDWKKGWLMTCFSIFYLFMQPEDILNTLQQHSAHQWVFRIMALCEVVQADKTIRAKPEPPFFMEGKFPLTSMGVLPDYKIRKLAPNDISKGGFTHGTAAVSHEPNLQVSTILLPAISETTKWAKVGITPLLWEVRLKHIFCMYTHSLQTCRCTQKETYSNRPPCLLQ